LTSWLSILIFAFILVLLIIFVFSWGGGLKKKRLFRTFLGTGWFSWGMGQLID
jgi:hypothetical protein